MEIKIHATPIEQDGRSYLQILSPVRVVNPVVGGEMFADLIALWDTGATNTCIPMKVAEALGIQPGAPTAVVRMKTTVTSHRCQFYLDFPTGDRIFVKDALALPKMQAQFVIGMDVMSKGVTTIEPDGQDGVRFTFTL